MANAIAVLSLVDVPATCELLVFGSSVAAAEANDVDVLVVYRRDGWLDAVGLRDHLQGLAEVGLVHVTMLTVEEEAGARFANEVGAVHVGGDALVKP